MQDLTENLKQKKLKVTPQRLAVYSYLYENTDHPSAESIYTVIKKTYPTISLATVYKTLKSLKEADLIQEINVGEDSFRYDATIKPHSHIICSECNDVKDYYMSTEILGNFESDIMKEIEFSVQKHQLFFYGICKKCLENKK